jgi:hypothetical protein
MLINICPTSYRSCSDHLRWVLWMKSLLGEMSKPGNKLYQGPASFAGKAEHLPEVQESRVAADVR